MTLITMPLSLSYRDAKGWIGRMKFWITEDDGAAGFPGDVITQADTLRAAVLGLTNGAEQNPDGLLFSPRQTLAYGTNAEYPAEWMKAVFTFTTDQGTISRFKVPAPKIAIFDTDGITVLNDGTQAAVVAFVNAVKNPSGGAFTSTLDGQAYTHFVGGILRLGKQPRRFNEFIKSAHLVAGEGE